MFIIKSQGQKKVTQKIQLKTEKNLILLHILCFLEMMIAEPNDLEQYCVNKRVLTCLTGIKWSGG